MPVSVFFETPEPVWAKGAKRLAARAAALGLGRFASKQVNLVFTGGPGIKRLSAELYPTGEGSHATASEVALTWYKYPETIQRKEMEPRIAPNGSFADAEDYRRTFPDGRIGSDPNQATPEHGKRFYDTAVEEVARDYEAWVAR